jgi:hypothetical protein
MAASTTGIDTRKIHGRLVTQHFSNADGDQAVAKPHGTRCLSGING